MEIEFDPAKSAANQEKHGIDFGGHRSSGGMLCALKCQPGRWTSPVARDRPD